MWPCIYLLYSIYLSYSRISFIRFEIHIAKYYIPKIELMVRIKKKWNSFFHTEVDADREIDADNNFENEIKKKPKNE